MKLPLSHAISAVVLLLWGTSAAAIDTSSTPAFVSMVRAAATAPPTKIGEAAPNFTLDAVVGTESGKEFKPVSLADFRGRWVVLFFYPFDFSFVCPTEIRGFNDAIPRFKDLNADVIGVSADSRFSHLAWLKTGALGQLHYPLLSDFKKEVAIRYGVLDEKEGAALRALFIIDPDGILQYQLVQNHLIGRSVEETLRVLQALQTEELCPLGWKPGEKTLGK